MCLVSRQDPSSSHLHFQLPLLPSGPTRASSPSTICHNNERACQNPSTSFARPITKQRTFHGPLLSMCLQRSPYLLAHVTLHRACELSPFGAHFCFIPTVLNGYYVLLWFTLNFFSWNLFFVLIRPEHVCVLCCFRATSGFIPCKSIRKNHNVPWNKLWTNPPQCLKWLQSLNTWIAIENEMCVECSTFWGRNQNDQITFSLGCDQNRAKFVSKRIFYSWRELIP